MPEHKLGSPSSPAFNEPLKLHREAEDCSEPQSHQEREILSSSLDFRTLKAALEQNGLWLEMNHLPSPHGSLHSVSAQLGESSRGVGTHGLPRGLLQKAPPHSAQPQELQVWVGSQSVNMYHPKENWYVLCSQIFQTPNWYLYLEGQNCFKQECPRKLGTWGSQSMEPPQRGLPWGFNLKWPFLWLTYHTGFWCVNFWNALVSLYLFRLLASQVQRASSILFSSVSRQLDQWLAHGRCSINTRWVHKSMSNLGKSILCTNPPPSSQQCYEVKSWSLLYNEKIKAQRGCVFFPGPHI